MSSLGRVRPRRLLLLRSSEWDYLEYCLKGGTNGCSIDGVLLHVAKPIRGAAESLQYLNDNNIPFILLTNGGGKREVDRVTDLSEKLGVHLTTDNFVQSHTPFQQLVDGPEGLRNKTILVTGSNYEKCRVIAKS